MIFSLQRLKTDLSAVIVAGVPAVNRAVINEKQVDSETHYNLLVEGYNLLGVMTTEGVDGLNTSSNHIDCMFRCLGIEAARQSIISEIETTMSSHGLSIDYRHISLLADVMCYRGRVLGITRFGVAQMKESVLMLASFEKTADHLFTAAIRGVKDEIIGVSDSIIMGTPIPVGTGLFTLLYKQQQSRARDDREIISKSKLLLHRNHNKM